MDDHATTTTTKPMRHLGWLLAVAIPVGAAFAACSAESPSEPAGSGSGTSTASGGSAPTGGSEPVGGQGTGGGFNPVPTPCQDHPGEIICFQNTAITCDDNGQEQDVEDCGEQACVPGVGCVLCIEGQFSCYGATLRSCDTTGTPSWVDVETCNTASQVCDARNGVCAPLVVTGGTEPTGEYYQYAYFTPSNSPIIAGCDTDSYGNYIYINRDGAHLDVYVVELLDSDNDGELEPNQHPANPDAPGPIEERVLSLVKTYDIPELGPINASELYATADRIYFLNWEVPGAIYEHVFATGVTTQLLSAPPPVDRFPVLAFDEVTETWFTGVHYQRTVFSFHAPTNAWVAEFKYPDLSGDHMDGMEAVVDPNTGETYVYVSDMTSDFIAQYQRERGGGWKQVNLFSYQESQGDHVEGMGFGALNHFWISGWSATSLYEIGGGDLAKYTEPIEIPE